MTLIARMEQGEISRADLPSDLVEIAARAIQKARIENAYANPLGDANGLLAHAVLTALLPTLRAQYRREALEEAAGVCDGHANAFSSIHGAMAGSAATCAKAIRSLKDKETVG